MNPISASELLEPVARQDYLDAMAKTAAGVTVVTSAGPEGRAGLTASSVTSVSADPPMVLVCVHHGADAHRAIAGNGAFCVNVLLPHQSPIANVFAGYDDRYPDRFACADWTALVTGAPVLTEALAVFDCRLTQSVEASSHTVFFGVVVAVRTATGAALLYTQRDYARPVPLLSADVGGGASGDGGL